jgi:hypothetical protein
MNSERSFMSPSGLEVLDNFMGKPSRTKIETWLRVEGVRHLKNASHATNSQRSAEFGYHHGVDGKITCSDLQMPTVVLRWLAAPLEIRAGLVSGYFNQLSLVEYTGAHTMIESKYDPDVPGDFDGFDGSSVGAVVGGATLGDAGVLVFRHRGLACVAGHPGYKLDVSSGDAFVVREAARIGWTREVMPMAPGVH